MFCFNWCFQISTFWEWKYETENSNGSELMFLDLIWIKRNFFYTLNPQSKVRAGHRSSCRWDVSLSLNKALDVQTGIFTHICNGVIKVSLQRRLVHEWRAWSRTWSRTWSWAWSRTSQLHPIQTDVTLNSSVSHSETVTEYIYSTCSPAASVPVLTCSRRSVRNVNRLMIDSSWMVHAFSCFSELRIKYYIYILFLTLR